MYPWEAAKQKNKNITRKKNAVEELLFYSKPLVPESHKVSAEVARDFLEVSCSDPRHNLGAECQRSMPRLRFMNLQGWRLHTPLGNLCHCLVTLTGKKGFPMFRGNLLYIYIHT